MKLTQMTLEHDQSLYQRQLVEQWDLCAGKTRTQCATDYLDLALQWDLCGATLFLSEKARGRSVWLAVHEGGVSLLCPSSMETRSHYSWPQLAAFGSDGDHLVLVVTSSQNGSHDNTDTEKLLFFMSKAKIHQATNLMTSYLQRRATIT
ncbi:Pleckstrin homology domain-containing family H member 1 [Geodia barretti]|uniref:Pleckstrin homology domain-containing family H member 1 n=1 Tax=Geodia barretti TaxID=519541 RepID=A0AA35X7P2_GEOBA|nr:Pleckstrin homology domain-containing family H member 1 [Geodia barretti]